MITIDKYVKIKEIEAKFSDLLNNKRSTNIQKGKNLINTDQDEISNPFRFLLEIEKYKFDKEKLREFTNKIIHGLCVIKLGITNGELQNQHLKKLKTILQKSRSNLDLLELNEAIESVIVCSDVQLTKSSIKIT